MAVEISAGGDPDPAALEYPCSMYAVLTKLVPLTVERLGLIALSGSDSLGNQKLINVITSTIDLPFPTSRLASIALRTLSVDAELSPLVQRFFSTVETFGSSSKSEVESDGPVILRTVYKATTNRMLRVAVNGFMESARVVVGVMEELDVDVLEGEVMVR